MNFAKQPYRVKGRKKVMFAKLEDISTIYNVKHSNVFVETVGIREAASSRGRVSIALAAPPRPAYEYENRSTFHQSLIKLPKRG